MATAAQLFVGLRKRSMASVKYALDALETEGLGCILVMKIDPKLDVPVEIFHTNMPGEYVGRL